MRNRITRALFTAAAAGATITTLGFAVASPAGAATAGKYFTPSGGPQYTTDANCTVTSVTGTYTTSDCGKAGYVASGRDFRYAQAVITVPDHTGSVTTDPALYVALDASAANNDFARVGVEPCTTGIGGTCPVGDTSGWEAFVDIDEPGTSGYSAFASLSAATEGDGVFVSVYFNQAGNSVHVVVTPPSGTVINDTYSVNGPVYTDAQALADWTTATTKPAPAPPSSDKVRDTQFLQGRFTTLNGQQGTFYGPWALNAVEATSNGQCPPNSDCIGTTGTGTLIAQPSYLWTDNSSLNGMFGDAFGIWRYPF
jgi:hypothetical protein